MSRQIIVRPEAEAEIADAFDWYEACVPGLGSDFLLCVDAVFNAVLRNPQQFPHIHRIVRRALVRRFPYEVFFVEDDERVVVLSVFNALLDRQIAALEREFVEEGGYSEQLASARLAHRRGQDGADHIPPCPECGKPMALRTARQGQNAGRQFWGCTAYPECKGVVKI